MGASITLSGESLIAQKIGAKQRLEVARFILANVPDLDIEGAVNRAGTKPPASQIVYTAAVTRSGYVNPNQVIYSLMITSSVGDFDFNWMGLETADNVLLAVAYLPMQQKRRNIPPMQIGNNVTRNFLVEFSGAQQLTGITVDASTWQHDFTVRLTGIDERERLSNRDIYGRSCFFQDSLQMERNTFGLYQLKAGMAYVEGVRVALTSPTVVQLPALPAKAWLDVTLLQDGSEVMAIWKVIFGATKGDYIDGNGRPHYVVELAEVSVAGKITDQRAWQPISSALIDHFAARNGDYAWLRARATTKADVDLDQLPNAKSDDPATNSSEILATTAALHALQTSMNAALVGMVAHFPTEAPPAGWLRANGASLSRTVYADLFARIGTVNGSDSDSTFNLPDLRGEFIRGVSDGRGVDTGRVVGSAQASQNLLHSHTGSTTAAGKHFHTASFPRDLVSGHTATDADAVLGDQIEEGVAQINTSEAPNHTHGLTINSSGGNEARPRNVALLACIKY